MGLMHTILYCFAKHIMNEHNFYQVGFLVPNRIDHSEENLKFCKKEAVISLLNSSKVVEQLS